jgi:uncharacterized protein (DUF1697 family)
MVYIALLRGVNVGGKNKLPMKSLGAICETHGCTAVRTYIQSGNIVFQASAKVAASFAGKVKLEVKKAFGFETTVILRTAEELRLVTGNNPFLKPGVDTKLLHVMFLADEPDLTDVVKLNPVCENDEAFSLRGKEIFLYLPNGMGRSKMGGYAFDKVLHTVGSTRNWQTVTKLLALAEGAADIA